MAGNPSVDASFDHAERWCDEAKALREILLESDLTEELKWGKPCYTYGGRNVCIVQRMKDFLALLFFKGALLKDTGGVLELQGPNSRAGYRMRFTSVQDVASMAKTINAYVHQAIEVERAGLQLDSREENEPSVAEEFQAALDGSPDLSAAFAALTPGRQREYNLYFSAAKRRETRVSRIEKCVPKIRDGKGLRDG